MKLEKTIFADSEDLDTPEALTVTLTVREVAFLAKLIEPLNPRQVSEIMPGGDREFDSIYGGLQHLVSDRRWKDGLMDAVREVTD